VTLAPFIAELRAIGLPISVSENVDATAALKAMPLVDRASLKSALAATLVKNSDHYGAFELVFDVFFAGGRFPAGQIAPYIIAQVIGAIAASALLYVIASGAAGFDVAKGFASNGYEAHSPGQYSLVACFIMEVVMTMMFLFVIMGATHGKAPAGFAPLAIGLALVMIHLVSIPVTNTSVNPARSTGPALFVGGWALAQLWLFWVAPLIGGVLGGVIYRWLSAEPDGVVAGQ